MGASTGSRPGRAAGRGASRASSVAPQRLAALQAVQLVRTKLPAALRLLALEAVGRAVDETFDVDVRHICAALGVHVALQRPILAIAHAVSPGFDAPTHSSPTAAHR